MKVSKLSCRVIQCVWSKTSDPEIAPFCTLCIKEWPKQMPYLVTFPSFSTSVLSTLTENTKCQKCHSCLWLNTHWKPICPFSFCSPSMQVSSPIKDNYKHRLIPKYIWGVCLWTCLMWNCYFEILLLMQILKMVTIVYISYCNLL